MLHFDCFLHTMAKPEFNNLIAQARASKPDKTIQRVITEKTVLKNEKQFSFYIDKTVLKNLKPKATGRR